MKNNIKGLIYMAKCCINNKIYIGQTIQGLDRRRKQHEQTIDTTKFHRALQKYGENNFDWYVLKDNIPYNELDMYEKKYITMYNSYVEGYNSTEGGRDADTFHSITYVIQCVETGIIYRSIRQAERVTKISNSNISKALKGIRQTAGGYHWKKVGVSTL